MSTGEFTHFDTAGRPRMVDVGDKNVTRRRAIAEGVIRMSAETARAIQEGRTSKGDVITIAEIAGITGAKRTGHPIPLSSVKVTLEVDATLPGVRAEATVEVSDRTGVEMEALTAVSVALLTVYDMCKSRDRGMTIESIRLLRKEGGRSGTWIASKENS
jgi:cyclic pyranopterin phosphate synthase